MSDYLVVFCSQSHGLYVFLSRLSKFISNRKILFSAKTRSEAKVPPGCKTDQLSVWPYLTSHLSLSLPGPPGWLAAWAKLLKLPSLGI